MLKNLPNFVYPATFSGGRIKNDLFMGAKLNNSDKLAKDSNRFLASGAKEIAVKDYFQKVFELNESGNEFPVDLDEVWPLAFKRKDHAVRELVGKFIEDVDYQVFLKNGENLKGGRPVEEYKISVSCLEYLVARRVREVFEVYRKVFHKTVKQGLALPDFKDPVAAARAWADEMEKRMLAEAKIKEDEPKVVFAETAIKAREGKDILVRDAKKRLESHGYYITERGFRCYLEETGFLVKTRSRWEITANVLNKGLAHYRYLDGCENFFTVLITEKGFQSILNALSKPRWFRVFEDCGGSFRSDNDAPKKDSAFDLDY